MKRIGEGKRFEADTYLPSGEQSIETPFTMEAKPELKNKINEITGGKSISSLTDEQKKQAYDIIKENPDLVNIFTNPKAGKSKNFLSKSTLVTMAGFAADMGAFFTKMGIMGGFGLGAKAAEAAVLFNDGYESAYNKKLNEGASTDEANSYGILHGAILSVMAKVSSKYETAMNVLKGGKSPLSKEILGISEETWNKIRGENTGIIEKLKNTVPNVLKEQGKMIGTYGVLAPTSSSIADNIDRKSVV